MKPGDVIGPYRVVDKLGEGGMGEVYRATDSHLKRQVAIKVLPEAVAADPERLARFQREAEVLAALNHPGIAQIYGLERSAPSTGSGQGGTCALVMELVEGPTLDDLIAGRAYSVPAAAGPSESASRGPAASGGGAPRALNVEDALAIARQIAQALEAAHEQGIVHRDLKPANIKVRDDGTVKVLDFGLAKALTQDAAPGTQDLSQSPTITTPAMTQMGMILGTAAYMSPEQARGKPVDRRADIWAFGCVLYEMLTGQRAFEGEDVSMTLSKVLQREPDFDALPADVPSRVRQVLGLCLRKDPKVRVHDIADVALALDGAFETDAPRDAEARGAAPSWWRRPVPVALAALVAGAVAMGLVAWLLRPAPEPRPVSRFTHGLPDGQYFSNLGRTILALSPDGTRLVYNTGSGLLLRTMDGLDARVIPGPQDVANPFFSADGQSLGFWELGELMRVDLAGGAPVVICALPNPPFGASWEQDGTILLARPEGILRVPADGGTPQLVIAAESGERMESPRLLPDDDHVLFTLRGAGTTASDWTGNRVVAQSLATGERTVLINGGRDARYVPAGYLVYAVDDGLFAMRFDADRLATSGSAVSVVQGVAGSSSVNSSAVFFELSETGTLVYVPVGINLLRTPVWAYRDGRRTEPIATIPAGAYDMPRLSPDGERVMLWAEGDAWVYELTSGRARAITRDGLGGVYGGWSPDGSRVAYSSARGGGFNVWAAPADGSGEPEQMTSLEGTVHLDSWSPDGSTLAIHQHLSGQTNILMVPVEGDDREPREFLVRPTVDEEDALFSPDGRYVAYESFETGRQEIYVRPYPGPGGAEPVSVGGAREPVWAANGELFYRTENGERIMVVSVATTPALRIGEPREVLSEPFYFDVIGSPRAQYDVTADGQRLLLLKDPERAADDRAQVVVVQNWVEELKERVSVE